MRLIKSFILVMVIKYPVYIATYPFICLYIYYYLVIGMSGFKVQSVIVCGVNLFAMPRMQYVVYAIEYKVVKSPCCKPVVVYCCVCTLIVCIVDICGLSNVL